MFKIIPALIFMVLMGTGFFLGHVTAGSDEGPGTVNDPLVSQSYLKSAVQNSLGNISARIQQSELKVEALKRELADLEALEEVAF